jgi:signal transduction histidine kinase
MINRLARTLHLRREYMAPEQAHGVEAIYERSQRVQVTLSRIQEVRIDEVRTFKHDIRNLMTPILGYTQLLISDRLGQIDAAMQTDCAILLNCIRELHAALDDWSVHMTQSARA